MKKDTPLISILLLSYNHEEFIEDAIKSVFAIKSDNYLLELRIIDDGSTDRTQEIISRLKTESPLPIYIDFKKHMGITAIASNFNELIFDAQGDYITFLASDDSFIKEEFEDRLNFLIKDKNLKLVYSNGINVQNGVKTTKIINGNMVSLLEMHDPKKVYIYLTSNIPSLYIQALIIRSEVLKDTGGFDEDLIADDWVLNIKIFKYLYEKNYKYKFYDVNAFVRNIHETNTSKDMVGHFKRVSQVIDKYFDPYNQQITLAKLYRQFGTIYLIKLNIPKGVAYLIKSLLYRSRSLFKNYEKNEHDI